MPRDIGHSSVFSGQDILYFVGGIVLNVDSPDQQVVRYVVQVTPVFEPGSGHADMVGGAFSFCLKREANEILA